MKRIESIQLWRVIACLMVFVVHLGQRISLEGIPRVFTNFGAYGVQLFFCISGFLIANSFFLYGQNNMKMYVGKRLIKILPLYYMVILYYFVVHNWILCDVPEKLGGGWTRYLLLLNGILPQTGITFWDNLGATWTIPYFVFAYIAIPILLKFTINWQRSIFLFLIVSLLANKIEILNGWMNVLEGMPYFIEGVIVYFCFKENKENKTNLIFTFLALIHIVMGKVDAYLISLFFVLLLINTKQFGFRSKAMKRLFGIIDKYSYTIYLVHAIIFVRILDCYNFGRIKATVIAIIGTAVLVVGVYHLIEKPIQDFLNNIFEM